MTTQESNTVFEVRKILPSILCILGIFLNSAFAQGDISDNQRVLFRNELSMFGRLNSNGYGLGCTYGRYSTARNQILYNFHLFTVKHPKEFKKDDGYGYYVYGKLNHAYAALLSIGKQHEMFEKLDINSVAISRFWNAGVSLGIQKPIYYYTDINDFSKIEKFNTSSASKFGKAPFKYGFDEITTVPGLFAELGVQFDYSDNGSFIQAFMIGVQLQAYYKPLEIMYGTQNEQFITTFFLAYKLGKYYSKR